MAAFYYINLLSFLCRRQLGLLKLPLVNQSFELVFVRIFGLLLHFIIGEFPVILFRLRLRSERLRESHGILKKPFRISTKNRKQTGRAESRFAPHIPSTGKRMQIPNLMVSSFQPILLSFSQNRYNYHQPNIDSIKTNKNRHFASIFVDLIKKYFMSI